MGRNKEGVEATGWPKNGKKIIIFIIFSILILHIFYLICSILNVNIV